jgi:hypothetical protein
MMQELKSHWKSQANNLAHYFSVSPDLELNDDNVCRLYLGSTTVCTISKTENNYRTSYLNWSNGQQVETHLRDTSSQTLDGAVREAIQNILGELDQIKQHFRNAGIIQ